jgi:DNA-binding beta-propeller fold protein YncE
MTRALAAIVALLVCAASLAGAQAPAPLTFERAIPLPGVAGRIDHLAFDAVRHRLYVAALGNDSVEVIDTRDLRGRTLTGFEEPQGVAVVPANGLVVVANGRSGEVDVLDPETLRPLRHVPLGNDADNVRVDTRSGHVWVAYGDGGLAEIDPVTGRRLRSVRIKGHPESFQLDPAGPRIFVNVPASQSTLVVDREASRVSGSWRLPAAANYPMAFDARDHDLLIGCRDPARLLVMATDTGRVGASLPIPGDADDVFFDEARGRVYVSGGEGFVAVLTEAKGTFSETARIATAPGARTSLFVPSERRLYVAAPARGGRDAEIRVYVVR